jgi:hypothetical protein
MPAAPHEIGIRFSRDQRVDPNSFCRVVESSRLNQAHESAFTGGVGGTVFRGRDGIRGGGDNDIAATGGEHVWDLVLHGEKDAAQVGM